MEEETTEDHLKLVPDEDGLNFHLSDNVVCEDHDSDICLISNDNTPEKDVVLSMLTYPDEYYRTPEAPKRSAQNQGFDNSARKRHRSNIFTESSSYSDSLSLFKPASTRSVATNTMTFGEETCSILKRKDQKEGFDNSASKRHCSRIQTESGQDWL